MTEHRIEVLPAALASQIAAGEVVERPASALKELLENSLDAEATRCDVTIEGGGITLLSVRDDGRGMSPEDAALCIERHATSKLRSFAELSALPSFGFRGEALPSIASVSQFRLHTRSRERDSGTEVIVLGGSEPDIREIGMAVGTLVEVKELFYNVPARRKFLRSSATESGHVSEVIDALALGNPGVTFTLVRDGRKAKEWLRANERETRVQQLLGDEELARVAGERGPLRIEAYLSRPERARAGAAGLRLFCNQRPIRDRAILHSVAQAYGSVLERGRYPRGVVYLDVQPSLVDVNVHPQKSEVRFADARAVSDALYRLLSAELAQAFSLPTPSRNRWAEPAPGTAVPSARKSREPERSTASSRDAAPDAAQRPQPLRPATLPVRPTQENNTTASEPAALGSLRGLKETPHDQQPALLPSEEPAAAGTSEPSYGVEDAQQPKWGRLRFLAQVRSTYLLCEGASGLYVLDQHAAAERVTFDRLRKQYHSKAMASQSLLFPLTLDVNAEQAETIEQYDSEIQRFGFELRSHSQSTVSLHAIPKLLQRGNPEQLARDLISELARSGRAFSDAVDLSLATMACHGSVRAGDTLSASEASALLNALDDVDFAGHCPHGRPIVSYTAWTELERKVGRR